MSLSLALTAEDFILDALGPKWTAVILPLQILCLSVVVTPARCSCPTFSCGPAGFVSTCAPTSCRCCSCPPASTWACDGACRAWPYPDDRLPAERRSAAGARQPVLDLSAVDYIAVLRPAFIACAVMAVGVLFAERSLPEFLPHAARLGLEAVTGAVVYTAALLDYSLRGSRRSGRSSGKHVEPEER